MTQRDQSDMQLSIEVPRSRRRSPLGEPCPKCGAAVGEECRTVTTGEPAPTHRARARLTLFLPVEGER